MRNILPFKIETTSTTRIFEIYLFNFHLGAKVGIILSSPLSGYICSSWIGWPVTFYIYGLCGYAWIVSFFFFGADSPAAHQTISVAEKKYIESSLGTSEEPKVSFVFENIQIFIINAINVILPLKIYHMLLNVSSVYLLISFFIIFSTCACARVCLIVKCVRLNLNWRSRDTFFYRDHVH